MTAIIGCSVAGVPLLMGDVLESTPAFVAPTDLYIPSVGSVALAEGGAYRPCGLVQKVCLVGPNLVFAWSGDVLFSLV